MRKLVYARQTAFGATFSQPFVFLIVTFSTMEPAHSNARVHLCPNTVLPSKHLSSEVGLLLWLKINRVPRWPRSRFTAPLLHSPVLQRTLPTDWFPASSSNHSEVLRQGRSPTEPLCTLAPATKHAKISTVNLDSSTDTVTHGGFS